MVKRFTLFTFFAFFTFANLQAQEVKGTITDENKEPIPGVTVVIDGSTAGTISDIEGNYSLKVEVGTVNLIFSFIGFTSQELTVHIKEGETQTLNLSLAPDIEILDEMVVIGYGTAKKRDLTGSISTVSSDAIMEVQTPSFESALQGQAPGLMVTQGSGLAGSTSIVRVRGNASISAGGDPLYVVDGIPITQDMFITGNSGAMNNNPLAAINPADIESVTILKDAASTGIYGARGANGVILVTTKRAKNKGFSVNFSTRLGMTEPVSKMNMLNSAEYLQMYQEAWENDGNTGQAPLRGGISWDDARITDTDWWDETTRRGFKQFYSLGVNFNKNWFAIYANYTYDNSESFLVGNKYVRNSGRINMDFKISKKLRATVSTSLSDGTNFRVNNAWSGGLGEAMSTALPIYPVYYLEDVWDVDSDTGDSTLVNEKGDYWAGGPNPVRSAKLRDDQFQEFRSINSLSLTYTPINNLNFQGNFGYDYMNLNEDVYNPAELDNTSGIGTADWNPHYINNYNISITGDYNWTKNGHHNFGVLGGWEYQRNKSRGYSYNQNFATGFIPRDIDTHSENLTVDTNRIQEFAFMSTFGRFTYNYKNKYFVQATARLDASSKFGSNFRNGFFPGVSAAWVISDEDFWTSNAFNYLKLKASWGILGNADLPNDQFVDLYQSSIAYGGLPILYPIQKDNPDLKWEESNNLDIGFELGLKDNRYLFELTYYHKWSKDVLLNVTLPRNTGYESLWDNTAKVVNLGIEFNFTARFVQAENFNWTSIFNIAYNYNEITDIGVWSADAVSGGTNDTRVVVGHPIGTNFLVRYVGVDPEDGRPIYLDINGNETYTWDPADRVPVGSVLPSVYGGWTNNFKWKNWSANLMISYSFGSNIYDSSSKRQLGVVTDWNMRTELFDRWTTPGQTDATYPRLTMDTETHGSPTPWINTDLWLKKGDFVRFKVLSINYTFPQVKVSNSYAIKNLMIGASITNFVTFTNFEGLDPEIARDFENATDRNMSPNITYLTAPQERTYNITLSMTF